MKALLALLLVFAAPAYAFDHKPTARYVKGMLDGTDMERAEVVDQALDSIVHEAHRQLWSRGFPDLAERMLGEWRETYSGSLLRIFDEGDHDPLSAWLAVWYMTIDAILGEKTMEITHLVDLKTFNFGIPVVFKPHAAMKWCIEQLADHPQDSCQAEYRRHFAGTKYISPDPYAEDPLHHGLAGVTAYWVTFAACEAALWGSDFSLACGLAGDACEMLIDRFPAPKISDKIWNKNNP